MNDGDDCEFWEAVSKKNFEDVDRLFPLASNYAQRRYICGVGFNPLHYASTPGMVQYCISSGIDPNVRNPETDETPLLTAVKLNQPPSVIRELLKQGADVEVRNKHSLDTPLNQAVQMADCRPELVEVLLEYGADPNTVNKCDETPLRKTCQNYSSDLRIVELLLKWGALVDLKNSKGQTPLSIAIQNHLCRAELVSLLLKYNAKVELETIKTLLGKHGGSYLNIMDLLLQHACFRVPSEWSSILGLVFYYLRVGSKIRACGMLVIKHSFLQCDDPRSSLVDLLLAEKKEEGTSDPSNLSHYDELFEGGYVGIGVLIWATIADMARNETLCFVRDRKLEAQHLKSFVDKCFLEIQRMRTDILSNDSSIFKVITSKTPKFCPEDKILKVLEQKRYPIYSDVILNKIKRVFLLDKLMLQDVYTIGQHGRIALDSFSVSCIAAYLNEKEIKNLVDAFCESSKGGCSFWDKLVKIEAVWSKRQFQGCSGNTSKIIKTHHHL